MLVVTIKGVFQWGYIFDGKFDLPMESKLEFSKNYYLIYAKFGNSSSSGIDIFKQFNKAFKLNLPTNFFLVKDAGFFTFSSKKTHSVNSKPLIEVFPLAPLPTIIKENAKIVYDTTSFWTTIELKKNDLFKTLFQVGYNEEGNNELSLSATFVSETAIDEAITTSIYIANLPDFKLLTLFEFKNLIFKYQFNKEKYYIYQIQGELCVNIFDNEYLFIGDVISTEKFLSANILASISEKIENPFFGLMRGVTFKDLKFCILYIYKTKEEKAKGEYQIQGTVKYDDEFSLTGQLYFVNTVPILAVVRIEKGLDIGRVFNQSIKSSIWPNDFINIIFLSGSQLYYKDTNKEKVKTKTIQNYNISSIDKPSIIPLEKIDYETGFNIYSKFNLLIMFEIKLEGNISIMEKGVKARIQLRKPIDIFVLKITSPSETSENKTSLELEGPIFYFNSEKEGKEMGFSCGLVFFAVDFGLNVHITAKKGKRNNELKIEGKLESTQHFSVLPERLPESKLSFSYSKSEGFHITDWPHFLYDKEIIDFIEGIEELAKKGGCEKIEGFMFKNLLETSFKIKPNLKSEDDELFCFLSGTYTMSVNIPTQKPIFIATIDFPDGIKFVIPNNLKMEYFLEYILNAIKGATKSFIEGLFDNREAISKLLVALAGKEAAKYALSLVCKGLTDSSVAKASKAGQSAASSSSGGSGALFATLFTAITVGISAVNNILDKIPYEPKPKLKELLPPNEVFIYYDKIKSEIFVNWSDTYYAQEYVIKFKRAQKFDWEEQTVKYTSPNTSYKITNKDLAGEYIVKIASKDNEEISDYTEKTILRLESPDVNIILVKPLDILSNPKINLKWESVTLATHYDLKINEETIETKQILFKLNEKIIEFTSDKPAGEYDISMIAIGKEYDTKEYSREKTLFNTIQSLHSPYQKWLRLDKPEIKSQIIRDFKLCIKWNLVLNTTTFIVRVQWFKSQSPDLYSINNSLEIEIELPVENLEIEEIKIDMISVASKERQIHSLWSFPVTVDYPTPMQIAQQCYKDNLSGEICAEKIIEVHPKIQPKDISFSMSNSGYKCRDTALGLKKVYSNIELIELLKALSYVYDRNESMEIVKEIFEH